MIDFGQEIRTWQSAFTVTKIAAILKGADVGWPVYEAWLRYEMNFMTY